MNKLSMYNLLDDPDFHHLVYPLRKSDSLLLEEKIVSQNAADPVVIWECTIIDGFERYQICREHNIAFCVADKFFPARDDVIAWVCRTQLQRKDLPVEMRKYLVGTLFEAETAIRGSDPGRRVRRKLPADVHLPGTPYIDDPPLSPTALARKIGTEFHLAWNTVLKYRTYAAAINAIRQKVPDVAPSILSGQYKVSHDYIEVLSSLTPSQIETFISRTQNMQMPFVRYKNSREEIQEFIDTVNSAPSTFPPSVKDMPEFDPDAEITAITLTIPTWVRSIDRIQASCDLRSASLQAKQKLIHALQALQQSMNTILDALKED